MGPPFVPLDPVGDAAQPPIEEQHHRYTKSPSETNSREKN
jgi:hypothetical protein